MANPFRRKRTLKTTQHARSSDGVPQITHIDESSAQRQSPSQVLVIDDDPEYRGSLVDRLTSSGFQVDAASSQSEAIDFLEQHSYQLVISDIVFDNSPAATGSDFILDHRELLEGSRTIAITGMGVDQINRLSELRESGVEVWEKGSDFSERLEQLASEARTRLQSNEVSTVPEEEAVAFALFDNTIKLVALTADGTYRFLDEEQHLHNILYLVSSDTLALQVAIDELESLVNDANVKEDEIQEFFERNPDFILNDEYSKAHSHIVLTKTDGEALIPDFVLEPIEQNALSDLLELKLPSAQVYVLKKNRMRFSAAVLEACAQLREYNTFFDEERNRVAIKDKYGLMAYRPRMFVIIGRRGSVNAIDARRIAGDVPNLHLRTYDDVVNRMRARLQAMNRGGHYTQG